MSLDLAVVGELMVDVHVAAVSPGGRTHGPIRLRAGGTAVNAALAAASIGARVCVVGRTGADAAGRLLRGTLADAGVSTRLSEDAALPTGTFVEFGDAVAADQGANATLSIDDVPRPLRATAVLVSAYLSPELARAIAGAADARWIAGPGGNVYIGNEQPTTGYEVVCTTFGERGAVATQGESIEFRAPPSQVDGRATGAGDAFAAGFLVELGRGSPLGECVERGCELGHAAAATSVP
jgi:sugar/nucleoside kinase (ribokinase family)